MKSLKFGAAIICILLIGLAPAWAADAKVEKGKEVYDAQKCKLCHAVDGVGNKKSPLDGVGKKLTKENIKKWIVSPKEMKADTKMKAYPNLPAEELDALIAYMMSLK